ncbi:putative disease resistance RPP13-like protein 1 [Dioscorea cayenensis subsp. rotundata]|uniref:Disease resistance RPP13-like protein 1 n=1 Tax=Dioscorea cayennensis subsp. rotundata TaxID=55577 RepID=A0AB40AVJ2_DIOCR|nr:putative disease resistance RPP13-like protein 1 [Dioscorea cayenensis subsp. rotundata]XP_039119017.1 putative disease resistance RPP13-like protein 1 [Dioscorea cayenensis subsp. rotundata]
MWVVDMMLGVVLSVVLWVVLSIVIPMFCFVVMMYLVMLYAVPIVLLVGLIMLRVVCFIYLDNYSELEEDPEPPTFDETIYAFQHYIMPVVVLKMLRIISWMLQDQMTKKMARVRDDLTKLQERLEKAYSKLEYADEEMMIVPYGTTNTLFHNLRAVSNDLQDLSDDLFKHEDKLKTMARMADYEVHWYSPFIYVYLLLIFFPQQINSQNNTLKNIDSRLEEILKQGLNNGLTLFNLNTTVEHEIDLVGGIEQDTENLVEKLMITSSSPGVHVYGIVGERGIGKTTLARKIFNHQTIKDKFHSPPPIWVDVHMNSTFHTIMNSINKFDGDLIQDKEILVVLNDVNDSKVLKDMTTDYMHLITNANVLVTTRYESVITHEGIYKHKLPLLSEEDGWALMCKLLFHDGEKGNMQHFEQIGKKMVNKCHGLPLSIKTIARILNAKEKNHSDKWEKVLENIIVSLELSNKTLPKTVYLLPYENLSPYIKQCFIFCAFFPEDYIFEKNILIQQWVVVGLVKKPSMSTEEENGEMQLLEDVANDYYMELLESNILQPAAAECFYYDDKAMCQMHGSMRSFGQHLVQNYGYFQGDVQALEEAATSPSSFSAPKLHHLVITNNAPLNVFPNIVKKQTSVRTLIFTSKLEITKLPKDLFQKLKLLRILDISGSDCRVLPNSLVKLVHLRYLNLSRLPIKTLPYAIGNLINLQHLILRYCGSLQYLPESIERLHKLRSIDLHQTPLTSTPFRISQLPQLTCLVGLVASDFYEISTLKKLQIRQEHINLTNLTLSCRGKGQPYEEAEKEKMQECFEALNPSSTLIQHIKINGYFGLEFPRWIMDLPFIKLIRLDLLKCKYCTELPPLYHFPLLEHLRVEDAWSIKHIDLDVGPWSNVPSLKSLILKDMPEWEEWTWEPYQSHLLKPVLELLEIINCPKLKSLPQGLAYHAESLATLTIYKAHSLEKVEGFASLKTATFFSNNNLSVISGFPATCNFEIDDCPKLDVTLVPQTSPTDAC